MKEWALLADAAVQRLAHDVELDLVGRFVLGVSWVSTRRGIAHKYPGQARSCRASSDPSCNPSENCNSVSNLQAGS